MKRIIAGAVVAAVGLAVLASAAAVGAAEPEVLFDLKTDKRIEDIYLIGENEDHILVTNEKRVWVYDANSGAEVWNTEVPGHTGMKLIWGNRYYIASMKEAMVCYEVATGKKVWEADMPYKMKDFSQSYTFDSGFILNFGEVLVGFDPNSGQVKWTSEKLDWNGKFIKEGLPVIYEINRSYGDRLLVLGDKVTQLLDAATGQLLGTTEIKLNHKNAESVQYIGDYAAFVFGKKMTRAMDLRDGREMWATDEEIDARRGVITLEHGGANYAVFVSKKGLVLFNLDKGEQVWQTEEESALRVEDLNLYDDGTLVCVGIKNYHTPNNDFGNRGGYTMAMALDFATGKVKYKELLAYATEPTLEFTIPLVGITIQMRQSIARVDWDYTDGVLVYCYGNQGKSIGTYGDKWKEDGGEGLVLFDPKTGKVKWRTDLVMWKPLNDALGKANDLYGKYTQVGAGPYDELGQVPDYIVDGGFAYLNANNTIVKVDLSTGQTVWEGPEMGFVSHFHLADGRLFGEIGYSRWTYETKEKKAEDKIYRSKENGYFVLDAATGQELWKVEKVKVPVDLFLHEYLPAVGLVLVCDGQQLQAIDVKKGGVAWQVDVKKLTGELTAKEGVAFIMTSKSSSYSPGLYSYTISTETTWDIQWAHGAFLADDAVLLISKEGPAMIGLDGKVKWQTEWDWKPDKVQLVPTVARQGLLYQYKKTMLYISLADGSTIWESKEKEAKDTDIFLDGSGTRIFIVEKKKNISAYKL
ncbi:PQQ-binding-like beta-propeller repeat protein [Candidatus Latescibacterota bacterium]